MTQTIFQMIGKETGCNDMQFTSERLARMRASNDDAGVTPGFWLLVSISHWGLQPA